MKPIIEIDYQKVEEITKKAIAAKNKGDFPFNKEQIFPDAIVPNNLEEGSKEHALFLLYSVSIDSMKPSTEVYSAMRRLTEELKDLTQLSTIKKTDLENILVPYLGKGIRTPTSPMTDPIETILFNAKKLEKEYKGDPKLLLETNVRETLNNIKEFKQYGLPKSALLIKNYVKFKIFPFSEEDIPIKIDRHTMRINLGCKVILNLQDHIYKVYPDDKLPKALKKAIVQSIRIGYFTEKDFSKGIKVVRSYKFINSLTDAYLQTTKREHLSAVELNDAFYTIGAYSCKENNAIFCDAYCPIPCKIRNPSDNNGTWMFTEIDKRKNRDNLFKEK